MAPLGARRSITAYWLGRVPYGETHALQERLVKARIAGTIGDTLLLLEHEPVITMGRGAKSENVLLDDAGRDARGIGFFETGRGGDVTFHGPGQLVAYPIFDLKPDRCDVRRYVRDLADVMIGLARDHGLAAGLIPDDPKLMGVWLDENAPTVFDVDAMIAAADGVPNGVSAGKIGAIGVRLSRWVTMHGFAFNARTDLGYFGHIVPCGIRALGVTSLAKLGIDAPEPEALARAACVHFARIFDADVRTGDADELRAAVAVDATA